MINFFSPYRLIIIISLMGFLNASFALETTLEKKVLSVKNYKQRYSLSCEIAAATVVSQFLGFNITEEKLLANIPYEKTPLTKDKKGNIVWGNPNKGFVGNYNGVFLKDGYGIYADPLAKTLQKMKIKAQAYQGYTLEKLYKQIDKNHPSIVWIPSNFNRHITTQYWKTPEGDTVSWIDDEHALVFTGYDKKNNQLYFMDVQYGQQRQASVQDFLYCWSLLNNQVIVFE